MRTEDHSTENSALDLARDSYHYWEDNLESEIQRLEDEGKGGIEPEEMRLRIAGCCSWRDLTRRMTGADLGGGIATGLMAWATGAAVGPAVVGGAAVVSGAELIAIFVDAIYPE